MYISIVIQTFNRVIKLHNLLKSIIAQTYKKFEIIIIDDHSSDDYTSIIDFLSKNQIDFTYHKNNENLGAPLSRNIGSKLCKYDYISFVDDDDDWKFNRLEECHKMIKKLNQKNLIIYSFAEVKNSNGELLYNIEIDVKDNIRKQILQSCFISSPSTIIEAQFFHHIGGFDPNFKSCQDWDLWVRAIYNDANIFCIPKILCTNYKHEYPSIGKSYNSYHGYYYFFKMHLRKTIPINPFLTLKYLYNLLKNFVIYYFKKMIFKPVQ